jgi:hypothetical protein
LFVYRFIEFADPRVTVKNSSTFRKSKCPLVYSNLKRVLDDKLESVLPTVDGIAVTTDGWTSQPRDHYQSLTLHFVNENFGLEKYSVACRNFAGRHTAQQVASLLDNMMESIPGLSPDCERVAVTDSGSNMLAGMKAAKSITSNLRCVDHIINTCVQNAWKEEESVVGIMKICTELTAKVNR